MRLLDALVRTTPPASERRYSLTDYAGWLAFAGHNYPLQGFTTSYGKTPVEPISADFAGYIAGALKSCGVVFAVELLRLSVFAEARFQWQGLEKGRPGKLFGTPELELLERPWQGGTTGDLLSRMLLDADLAGNSYTVVLDGELVRLRPDYVDILLEERVDGEGHPVGYKRVAYAYYKDGQRQRSDPAIFLPDEVAHFAPQPDPDATYRGMSWITPVVREIQADISATKHKGKFFENAATPNLAISLPKEVSPGQFKEFVELTDAEYKGGENAYKTLYTGGGADVTVIGADMKQLDFKATQGAGETRIAAAGGAHPVLVGLSEGMQGASLNAGNFGIAKRAFADARMRPLWRNAAGSLETLFPAPAGARLWTDTRDVAFLREDEKDAAEILGLKAAALRQLIDAGFQPDAAVETTNSGELDFLTGNHSGLFSVQLQPPGTTTEPPEGDK